MATVANDSSAGTSPDLKPTEENIPDFTVAAGTTSYKDDFFCSLQMLRENEHMTDCEIHVNDTTFNAHSLVLASACEFFKAKFSFESKCESIEKLKVDNKVKIILDNLDEDVFCSIMDYLYSGDIKITYKQMKKLVEACEFLLLLDMKKKCEEYIVQHVKPAQCISWARFASKHSLTLVADKCDDMLQKSFREVVVGPEFPEISLMELIEIMKSLHPSTADDCLQACVSWVMHDLSDRKDNMLDIIQHITLEHCSFIYIDYLNQEYGELVSHPDIQKRLLKATLNKMFAPVSTYDSNDETGSSQLTLVSLMPQKEIKYFVKHKSWKQLSKYCNDVNLTIPQLQCCKVPNGVFVYADAVGSPPVCPCYVFSTLYKTWQCVHTNKDDRKLYALVNIGNKVYILGGLDENNTTLNRVQCLDLDQGVVLDKPPMIFPTVEPLAVPVRSYIYVLVNDVDLNEKSHRRNLQCFNSITGEWNLKSKMPETIKTVHACSAVAAEGKMYIVGGDEPVCAAYDPTSDSWSTLQPPLRICRYSSVFYDNGKIVLLGGETDDRDAEAKDTENEIAKTSLQRQDAGTSDKDVNEDTKGSNKHDDKKNDINEVVYIETDKIIEYDMATDRWSHCDYTLPCASGAVFAAKVTIRKEN